MSKTKTPFLSMGSSGTLGRAITSQKRGARTLLRTKPTPADPYSLPQAYQRWLYQDYCAEWSALSEADKQTWRSAASRFHMPGMAYFLRNRLNTLPDIAGGWHLDSIPGGSVIDFSKNLNHGTVYGATLVDGIIDHALLFDGVDDKIDLGNNPSLFPPAFTYEAWINHTSFEFFAGVIMAGYNEGAIKGALFFSHGDKSLHYSVLDGVDAKGVSAYNAFTATGIWYHVAATFDGLNLALYVNGILKGTNTQDPIVYDTAVKAWLGCRKPNHGFFGGIIDHALIYTRALTPSDIKRHSDRRYP